MVSDTHESEQKEDTVPSSDGLKNLKVQAKQRSRLVVWGMGVGAIIFLVVLYIGLQVDVNQVPSALIGKHAPPFIVKTVSGENYLKTESKTHFSLDAYKGQPVILNFWASWCVSCRQEAHFFEEFWQLHKDDGVNVLGIAIQDSVETALNFGRSYGKTYPLGLDVSGKASLDYGVSGVPETFFITKEGVIVHKEAGPVSPAMLEKFYALIK